MTFEVVSFRIGELRIDDVPRAALCALRPKGAFAATVLTDASAPIRCVVALIDKPSGRGARRALACPACRAPRRVLYVTSVTLACAGCSAHRTRRQAERSLASWRRLDGALEDRFARLMGQGGGLRPTLRDAQEMADALVRSASVIAGIALESAAAAIDVAAEVSHGRR